MVLGFAVAPDILATELSSFERVDFGYGADLALGGGDDSAGIAVASRAGTNDEEIGW